MPNSGKSVIGVVQQEALATATNLDTTAAGLRDFEPKLLACSAHLREAMGHSHQADVGELHNVVLTAISVLNGCADSVALSGHRVREIEART